MNRLSYWLDYMGDELILQLIYRSISTTMHAPPFRSIVKYFYTQASFYKTVWSGSHLLKRHLRLWKLKQSLKYFQYLRFSIRISVI